MKKILLTLLVTSLTFAGNNLDTSDYFQDCDMNHRLKKCKEDGTILMLSAVDIIAGGVALGMSTSEKYKDKIDESKEFKRLQKAQDELDTAMRLATVEQLNAVGEKHNKNTIYHKVVSMDIKQDQIAKATQELQEARKAFYESDVAERTLVKSASTGEKLIKKVWIASGVLFLVDFADRIYTWGALEKRPELSPTYIRVKGLVGELFEE